MVTPEEPATGPRTSRDGRRKAPAAVRTVVTVALLEALALVGLVGAALVQLLRGTLGPSGFVIGLLVLSAGLAAVLVAAARALLRGRRRARGPLATWQLLQGATAMTVLQATDGPVQLAAWTAFVVAAVALVALLAPSVVRFTDRADPADPATRVGPG